MPTIVLLTVPRDFRPVFLCVRVNYRSDFSEQLEAARNAMHRIAIITEGVHFALVC